MEGRTLLCLFVPSPRPLPSNSRDRWLARESIDRGLSRRRCLDEFVILRTRPPLQTAPLPSGSPSISIFGCVGRNPLMNARGRWSSGPTGEVTGKTATPMGRHFPIATALAASAILRPTLSERVRLMIDTRQYAPATLHKTGHSPRAWRTGRSAPAGRSRPGGRRSTESFLVSSGSLKIENRE